LRSIKAVITDPSDLRSFQLFGKPALIFFVILPHLLNWLRITLPEIPSLLFVLHSLFPLVFIKFLFSAWPAFVWGACFFGLWHVKPWAWWLAVVLDAVMAGSYLYQAVSQFWSIDRGGTPGPPLLRLVPDISAGQALGLAGLFLILQPVSHRYFSGKETGLEGLPVETNTAIRRAMRLFAGKIESVVKVLREQTESPSESILLSDKAILGFIGASQLILCFGYLVFFFPWAFLVPVFGFFLLLGIISAIYLGSRQITARIFAFMWGATAYAYAYRDVFNGNRRIDGMALFFHWFATIALQYLLFSLIFHAGHLFLKHDSKD
jgi:hypothetical protein